MPIIKSLLAITLLSLIYLSTALAAEQKKCLVDEDPICFFERAETNFYKADPDRVLIANDYKTFINRYKNNIIIDEKKLAIAYQHLADINWQRTHYKFNYFPDNTYESALKIIDYYNKAESYGHESASGQLCNIYDDLFGYPFNPDNIEQKKKYRKLGIKYCKKYIDTRINTQGIEALNDLYGLYDKVNVPTARTVMKLNKIEDPLIFFALYNLGWLYAPNEDFELLMNESAMSRRYLERSLSYCHFGFEKINNKDWCKKYGEYVIEKGGRALNRLGYIYTNGISRPIDMSRAIEYYEYAAELGDFNATSDLGDIYLEGKSSGQADTNKAVKWYKRTLVIKPDDPGALLKLGMTYYHGIGISKDIDKAKEYFNLLIDIPKIVTYENYLERFRLKVDHATTIANLYINKSGEIDPQEKKIVENLCDGLVTKHSKDYAVTNFVNACLEYVKQDDYKLDFKNGKYIATAVENKKINITALEYAADFYRYGIGVNKSTWKPVYYHKDIIDLISANKEQYLDEQNKISSSKYYIAKSIINAIDKRILVMPISTASELLEDLLADPKYSVEARILLSNMKIDGWGIKKDLDSAEDVLLKLKDELIESTAQFERGNLNLEEIQLNKENLKLTEEQLDRIYSIKAGYNSYSNIESKFPANYKGVFQWTDYEIGNYVRFSIKNVKRIGLNVYRFTGLIDYDYITEDIGGDAAIEGHYNISGYFNSKSKHLFFDEYDTGNEYTFESASYSHGDFYGQFSEDFSTLAASYVLPDKSFGVISAKRIEKENKNRFEILRDQIDVGKQYALLIGNNNYENINNLVTATADARSFAEVLKSKYGFIVEEPLIDATRNDILLRLDNLANLLNKNDSLLIFYAGHGRIDEDTQRGYWTPVDGLENSYINDIPNDTITNVLKKIKAKHILVIADTCYSGSLIRSSYIKTESKENTKYFEQLNDKKSRKVITSGGLEPVSDSGDNGHSAFANAMLQELNNNEKILTAENLYQSIKPIIMSEYQQTPLYNPVNKSGDLGGELLFIPIQ